jgi:hypothetical protein
MSGNPDDLQAGRHCNISTVVAQSGLVAVKTGTQPVFSSSDPH